MKSLRYHHRPLNLISNRLSNESKNIREVASTRTRFVILAVFSAIVLFAFYQFNSNSVSATSNVQPISNANSYPAYPNKVLTTTGTKRVAVVRVNYADASVLFSKDDLARGIFTDTNNYFKEVSNDKFQLSGSSNDVYSIPVPYNQPNCVNTPIDSVPAVSEAVNNEAYSRLLQQYPGLANYDMYVFIHGQALPRDCYRGYAAHPGHASTTFMGVNQADLYVHEMGHGLGLEHAGVAFCYSEDGDRVPISGSPNCGQPTPRYVYEDLFDSMGTVGRGFMGHYNAGSKVKLGWISSDLAKTITTSQTVSLDYQETAPRAGLPKLLRIPRLQDASGKTIQWFEVEWRAKYGFDANLANENSDPTPAVYNGGSIRLVNETYPSDQNNIYRSGYSSLIDSKPWTKLAPSELYPQGDFDINDAPFENSTLYDPISKIQIKTVVLPSTNGPVLSVKVTFNVSFAANTITAKTVDASGSPISNVEIKLDSVGSDKECSVPLLTTVVGKAIFQNCPTSKYGNDKQYVIKSINRVGWQVAANSSYGVGSDFTIDLDRPGNLTIKMEPIPSGAVGTGCASTGNDIIEPTGGKNVIVRTFTNCISDADRIGEVEVQLKSVGSTNECNPRIKTTNALQGTGYGEATFTNCPIAVDGTAKTYEVSSISRPGYHVGSNSPTKVGTRFLVYGDKTPIIRIVMEAGAPEHPDWWWNSCDSTGVAGNPDMCG